MIILDTYKAFEIICIDFVAKKIKEDYNSNTKAGYFDSDLFYKNGLSWFK